MIALLGSAHELGVEEHLLEGSRAHLRAGEDRRRLLPVPQHGRLDVALEALRDSTDCAWRPVELWEMRRAAAVGNVMRPYVESLL